MLVLDNVFKVYNKGKTNEFEALKGVSLKVDDGELVAIIGKSGAGKSTLLHILACIEKFESGTYTIDDVSIQKLKERMAAKIRNEKIGVVIQDFALVEDFSCIENVMLPLDFSKKREGRCKEKAVKALQAVGMGEYAKKNVSQLSGGQKQRVAIARAIVNEPSVILADEPTGALNQTAATEVIESFLKINRDGTTILMVTHDSRIASMCERILYILDGEIRGELKLGKKEQNDNREREQKTVRWLAEMGW